MNYTCSLSTILCFWLSNSFLFFWKTLTHTFSCFPSEAYAKDLPQPFEHMCRGSPSLALYTALLLPPLLSGMSSTALLFILFICLGGCFYLF